MTGVPDRAGPVAAYLTAAEAAAAIGETLPGVYALIRSGQLDAVKVRGRYRVPLVAVRAYQEALDYWTPVRVAEAMDRALAGRGRLPDAPAPLRRWHVWTGGRGTVAWGRSAAEVLARLR